MKAARNLGAIYNSLGKSVERLSSGLRINNAADDAAGLATRELMRADIAATNQGVRNAADALSLVQTADGALGVIDAKLIRMKELAEQAANAIYSTVQRELINSEYQAMAAEIDRIASSTNFNGVKLLDGTMNSVNNGRGLMVHFGVNNAANEDYYFIRTDDARATTGSGLRIGGDGDNDIWSTGTYPGADTGGLRGCCGGGFTSLDQVVQISNNGGFMYGYNWDGQRSADAALLSARYLAGRYFDDSGTTLGELVNLVNGGTQSRVGVQITGSLATTGANYTAICLGNEEAYYVGCSVTAAAGAGATDLHKLTTATTTSITSAINNRSTRFWAMLENGVIYVFAKDPGNHNDWEAQEKGTLATTLSRINFINVETGQSASAGAKFTMGGQHWGRMEVNQTGSNDFSVALVGQDIGAEKDLRIMNSADPVLATLTGLTGGNRTMPSLLRAAFTQIQNAADGLYDGSHVRTQEAGQKALDAVKESILKKDQIRARFGSIAERLESTIEALTIQAENLQIAESRISDVDVATEMTEFTKNNVLAQAATAMLAQANSLSSLVLTLIR
jgi:flagellin